MCEDFNPMQNVKIAIMVCGLVSAILFAILILNRLNEMIWLLRAILNKS